MILLFCRRCDTRVEAMIRFPTECPRCGLDPARWTTFRPVSEPTTPYHPSATDNAFLKSLHITEND